MATTAPVAPLPPAALATGKASVCTERTCRLALSIGDWIWEVNRQWIVTFCSPGAQAILGTSAEKILGTTLFDRMPPEEALRLRRQFETLAEHARPIRDTEHLCVRDDGAEIYVLHNAMPFYDDAGEVAGYRGVTRDITHRKRSEQLRDILTRELQGTAEELKRRNEALEEANSQIETFMYATSHDLRSPLINLVGFANRLDRSIARITECLVDQEESAAVRTERARDIIQTDVAGAMTHIHAAVERFESVISGLLRLSRTGREVLDAQPIDMQALVSRVVDSFAVQAGQENARITIHDLPPAVGDINAVSRVWSNLICNAIKFLVPERPGRIEIGCRGVQDGRLVYYVRDNGVGIEPRQHERIFRLFQRLDVNNAQGDGLGLAIIRKIIDRHGGTVTVDSQLGCGSTFSFTLSPAPDVALVTTGAGE
jgi:PAS domain S-box-containing protein